jgi:hypothetical protein
MKAVGRVSPGCATAAARNSALASQGSIRRMPHIRKQSILCWSSAFVCFTIRLQIADSCPQLWNAVLSLTSHLTSALAQSTSLGVPGLREAGDWYWGARQRFRRKRCWRFRRCLRRCSRGCFRRQRCRRCRGRFRRSLCRLAGRCCCRGRRCARGLSRRLSDRARLVRGAYGSGAPRQPFPSSPGSLAFAAPDAREAPLPAPQISESLAHVGLLMTRAFVLQPAGNGRHTTCDAFSQQAKQKEALGS